MTDAELIAELALPAYAGMTAAQKAEALNLPKVDYLVPKMVPKATVLQIIGVAPFRAASLPEPGRTGWLELLANIRALTEGLIPSDAGVAAMLSQAVSDGVLTEQEKATLDSLGQRPASRAEQLWGEGTIVTLNDIARVI